MPAFSIIVPIYNAEQTLRRCLDTLCAQTVGDFEVLMIENGSTDTSSIICREYAERDSRFILHICAENRGPSGARNLGLEEARGEFIAFVDSDDSVETDYLDTLLSGFQTADVVFFGHQQISAPNACRTDKIPSTCADANYYETLLQLYDQDLFGYTWGKAFRRNVIGALRFPADLNLLEDEVFTCHTLTTQQRIAIIPKAIYHYFIGNTESLVGRTHPDYCRKVDAAYMAWKTLLSGYAQRSEALASIANAHVNRCMYYGFERNVDVDAFFISLAETQFFQDSTLVNHFSKCIRNKNLRALRRMRRFYRLKVKIAGFLRR